MIWRSALIMDQKNTRVECNAITCLYNYKGICDQYAINLDMYGQCKDYCECEKTEAPAQLKSDLEYDEKPVYVTHNETADRTIIRFKNGSYIELKPTEEKPKRGKRAELPIIDDPMSLDEIGKIPEWTMTINRLQGHLGMCMWCDYHRSNCGCAHKNPVINEEKRECYSIQSTGANQ